MVRVIVLGEKNDNCISRVLLRSLGEKMCVEAIGQFGMVRTGSGSPDVLLFDTHKLSKIDGNDTILVFKKRYFGQIPEIAQNCTLVLEESNTALLNSMIRHPFRAICCGLSQRNTLTVSSMRSDETVISLQRELSSVFGNAIEPAEFTVRMRTSESYYTLLAVTAVHLLLDMAGEENSF